MENIKAPCLEKKEVERRDLAFLKAALMRSWRSDTSSSPKVWNTANPMLGQSAVTALIVQDYFGGKLVKVDVFRGGKQSDSYHYNELDDGKRVDLTHGQFVDGITFGPKEYVEREVVFSFPDTVRRYELLKNRVEETLGRYRSNMKMLDACPLRDSAKT
jgi:hypothetical protein